MKEPALPCVALLVSTVPFGDTWSINQTASLKAGIQCDCCDCKNSSVYDIVIKNSKVEVETSVLQRCAAHFRDNVFCQILQITVYSVFCEHMWNMHFHRSG